MKKTLPKGFTLMELLVALAIFSLASLVITNTFVLASRSQRRGVALQKVQSDGRLIMNTLADQARQATINYGFYTSGISNPVGVLALTDRDGRSIIYRKSADDFASTVCPSAQSTPCLELTVDGGTTWAPVTSRDIKVPSLKFYIAPANDPFALGGPNIQPRITIVMTIQGATPVLEEQAPLFLQTTVSSRVYKR